MALSHTAPRISAVIITRNEEQNIGACLSTVQWCDEIIVVDMESEDRTRELAGNYTDKIFSHKKVLAFDIARQYAVEKSTGEWILWIDADELLPVSLKETLLDVALHDKTDIVYMPRMNFIMGSWIRHTGWWPDYQTRFFKKGAITFIEKVHDFLNISETARKLHLPADEKNAIVHFNYRDSGHFIEKLNRYTDIEAQRLFDDNTRFSLLRMFASALRETAVRFLYFRGYKDGYRGFFLSIMSGFYRMLTHIKLWEKWQNKNKSIQEQYGDLKDKIRREYTDTRRAP